ncbi:hypothetical protein [Okeania sp. SIO3I5]|uniref:hypothetical protein n=1 Tax=Okeania sp. SIO3I5 TaxID=2607805 RepID=UPI0025EAB54E|nr:hypothetical protein [Okeania sp. SIO3I5]
MDVSGRSQLLLWCRQRIVNQKFRPATPVGRELGARYDELLTKYSSDGSFGTVQAITTGLMQNHHI